MTSISYDAFSAWSNYHLTIGRRDPGTLFPEVRIEDAGRVHAGESPGEIGFAAFAAAGAALRGHVARVVRQLAIKSRDPVRPLTAPFAAGLVGRGWSFAPLIGAEVSQLDCSGLTGCMALSPGDLDDACAVPADRLALVGAGTRLRELADWGARRGLTVATSGTHLGPTLAGACATSSHGSRLGYGGIQNMVRGMHLVTGPDAHVWLERASCPVLTEAAAATLGGSGTPPRVVRNDALFDDALVNLGCMGIVNCLAVELVDDDVFALLLRDRRVDAGSLDLLARGCFDEIAAALGGDGDPVFYEVTFDPHDWTGPHTLHTLYLTADPLTATAGGTPVVRPADAIARLAATLPAADLAAVVAAPSTPGAADPLDVPIRLFDPTSRALSAFDHYREVGGFDRPGPPDRRHWRDLHRDEITGGVPGALYNASFAIERSRLGDAVPAICAAVRGLPKSFVFTVRFVSEPDGTLAFTRFVDNAVIEIDGLSPFACGLALARLMMTPNPDPADVALLGRLGRVVPDGAAAVRAALATAAIPCSMHWAKLGALDKAKVFADFGDPVSDPHSLIRRWRDTRDTLLGATGCALFWNEAAVSCGLLDRPTTLPP